MAVVSATEFEESLEQIISHVISSDSKAQPTQIRSDVDLVCKYAERQGLSIRQMRQCLDLILSANPFEQKSRQLLLKNLYPLEKVPSDVINLAICSLGPGATKPGLPLQQSLLKWLIMIYPIAEDPVGVSSLYSALFNLLDMIGLRSLLTHLLALVTKKKHVKPYRIEMLQRLLRNVPRETGLERLCQVYEQLAPCSFEIPKVKSTIVFPHPDTSWAERLQAIHEKKLGKTLAHGAYSYSLHIHARPYQDTLEQSRDLQFELREAKDVAEIAKRLEKIRDPPLGPPDLGDQYIQQFLSLDSRDGIDPVQGMLSKVLEQQLEDHTEGEPLDTALLENILAYARHVKSLPLSAADFFQSYLPLWNGRQQEMLMLDLLSYLPVNEFSDLQSSHLQYLEAALLKNDPISSQIKLLNFYTQLLQRWTAHLLSVPNPPSPSQHSSILALSAHTNLLSLTILSQTPPSSSLSPSPPTPPASTAVLKHLHAHLPLIQAPLHLPLPPPTPLQIYALLFTNPTLPTITSLCSLLARYKTAFEPTTSSSTSHSTPPPRPPAHIQALNASLIDTCNLLFRTRAFNTNDTHALGCMLPAATKAALDTYIASLGLGAGLGSLTGFFGLSCHPALVGISQAAMQEYEERELKTKTKNTNERVAGGNGSDGRVADDEEANAAEGGRDGAGAGVRHAGPVTQRSLAVLARDGGVNLGWKEYRVLVLRWLEDAGAGGIGDLGQATMRGLGLGEKGLPSAEGGVSVDDEG